MDCNAGGGGFPTITSIAGSQTFCIGLKRPLSIGTGSLTSVLVLNGFTGSATDVARRTSMDELRQIDRATASMIAAASSTTQQAVDISADFSTDPTINTVFPNTGLANQLKQVAKVIKLVQNAPGLSLSRQIFFVSQGGHDTHQNQLTDQGNNFLDLSQAMNAFYAATVELGLQNNITTFTLSDFGRTLQPSGSGGSIGSDHGWGSHQLVMGDAVLGNNFYGTPNQSTGKIFPTLQAGGIDDTTNSGSSGRGRWIPTTAFGPVRRDAGEVVRRRRPRHGSGVPEDRQLRHRRTSGSWAPLRDPAEESASRTGAAIGRPRRFSTERTRP